MEFHIQHHSSPKSPNVFTSILSLIVFFLSGVIIWGWLNGDITLVEFISLGSPIYLNTALALALSALGVWSWILNARRLSPLLGLLLLLLSSMVILHYFMPLNTTLSMLLTQESVNLNYITQGMGIYTAIIFLLFGAFFLSTLFANNKNIVFYQACLAVTIVTCSIAGFIDYWFNVELVLNNNIAIHGGIPFALAAAFFALGTALITTILYNAKSPYIILAFLIPFGLVSSIQAYLFLSFFDTNTIKERFNNHASTYVSDILRTLNDHQNELISLKGFYASSQDVTEKEFTAFLDHIVQSSSSYFLWAPHNQRQKEPNKKKSRYRIKYVYPSKRNNLAHNELNASIPFNETMMNNDTITADKISILYSEQPNNASKITMTTGVKKQDKPSVLKGILVKNITLDHLIQESIQRNHINNQHTHFSIYQLINEQQPILIYTSHEKTAVKLSSPIQKTKLTRRGIYYNKHFNIGENTFLFYAVPSQKYIQEQGSYIPLLSALAILVFIILFSYYFHRSLSIRQEVEKEVQEKTKDLDIHQARLKEAQKLANVGSWRYFVKDHLLILNDYLLEMLALGSNESTTNLDDFTHHIHKNDQESLKNAFQTCLNQGEYFEVDIRYLYQDDSCRFFSFRGEPKFNIYGNIEEIVGSVIDITEHKFMERKLQEIVDTKEQFTSMVTHELRTPLVAIKESINLILDGIDGEPTEKQKKFLTLCKNNIDRLNGLINNVLDFYKGESGIIELNKENHNIKDVLHHTVEFMKPVAQKKNLELHFICDCEPPPILFDKDKIVQVLTNLLNNAFKFTDEGSVSVSIHDHHDNIEVRVQDTGPGIAADQCDLIFESYKQVGDSTKKQSGTGLGLTISKQIIEAHQGNIGVESDLGKGASFFFTIPKKKNNS